MYWGGGWGGHGSRWEEGQEEKAYDQQVVTRLFRYILPYKRLAFIASIGMIGYAVTSTVQPFLIGKAIDDYILNGDLRGLNLIGIAFVVLAVASWVFQRIQLTTTAWVGHRVLYELRMQLFRHLQKLSLSFYDRMEVGRIMSRVQNDVAVLQELLTTGVLTIAADFLGLGLVIFFLFYQDVQLAFITLSVVPLLALYIVVWQRRAKIAFSRVRQSIAVVNANLQENVSGVRVIQSLSREDENSRRFDAVNADNLNANIRAGRVAASIMPVVEILVAVATALVILVGGMRVLGGDTKIGVLISFTLYVQRFFEPIRDIVLQYTQLQRAMAGGQRVFEVLDTKPEVVDAPDAFDLPDITGEVVFDNVSFSYGPDVPVLRDINLQARPGETIALVGPTGAGKTTITALVCRFYDVTSGRVLIDGYDIRDISRESLARRLGVVLQDPFLFSGTIAENIRYARPEAGDNEVEEAAKVVGAHEFITRLPEGYNTVLHERGQNLSMGQRQLIAFARAVLSDPRILILDEATANVDTATEVLIQRALKRLLADRTSFVIAHRLSTIRNADRIVVIDGGAIVEEGTHDELLALGGLYSRLYYMTYQQVGTNGNGHRQAAADLLRQPS